ncbi:MAG: hypothetical protein KME60_01340 [Cyanomargarita calcarea GSE-NOS-MK-12-04C]|jgi:hypothetical protein|uniref:Uncharacterized protein n=1 Tax=Cyanomargarita calcarea GSE-NOS-MK-12-04C TaxID=2839659 RepID=A0A951UQ86_9CYAN|nr:hypothetical protein [Cyanomargarita calcarea GSE-NOS-MK-12-04C]
MSTVNDNRQEGFGDVGVLVTIVLIALIIRFGNLTESNTDVSSKIINTSEIVDNTSAYIGKTVTIRSKPIRKNGFSSFTVTDNRFLGKEPLLVVNASGVPFNLPADRNAEVLVIGEVRNFGIPEIEQEFNLNLQDQYYTKYTNKPVIVAKSVAVVPRSSQDSNQAAR